MTLFFGDPLSTTFCAGLDVKTMQGKHKGMSKQRRVFSKISIPSTRSREIPSRTCYAAGGFICFEVCFTEVHR